MRSKTAVRPSATALPLKRNSEGIETSKSVDNAKPSDKVTLAPPVPAPVFPVKSVVKSTTTPFVSQVDKENINPVDWDDLDAEDSGDPLMVSDYVVEIFDYMKELEVNF